MNVIQKQVNDFMEYLGTSDSKVFIQKVRDELQDYHKTVHKLEFLQRVSYIMKIRFDEHTTHCLEKASGEECDMDDFYEASLFFLQNEIDEVDKSIEKTEFTCEEKLRADEAINQILKNTN